MRGPAGRPPGHPDGLQVFAGILALVALAIACLATFLVALVAWPLYGGRSATDDAAELERDGRRLKQGLVLTLVALAVLAMGTASGWWPQDEGGGDIAVQATSGERWCGSLADAGPAQNLAICELLRCSWVPRSVLVPNRRRSIVQRANESRCRWPR